MAKHTTSTLDATKMRRVKEIILAKFGAKRSAADKEGIWEKCKVAIGQKCNYLRTELRKRQPMQ